jgi:hypothetical protein
MKRGEKKVKKGPLFHDVMRCTEAEYLRKLMLKHGKDYSAMEHDIKLNAWQLTATVLKKRCLLYEQQFGPASARKP